MIRKNSASVMQNLLAMVEPLCSELIRYDMTPLSARYQNGHTRRIYRFNARGELTRVLYLAIQWTWCLLGSHGFQGKAGSLYE